MQKLVYVDTDNVQQADWQLHLLSLDALHDMYIDKGWIIVSITDSSRSDHVGCWVVIEKKEDEIDSDK